MAFLVVFFIGFFVVVLGARWLSGRRGGRTLGRSSTAYGSADSSTYGGYSYDAGWGGGHGGGHCGDGGGFGGGDSGGGGGGGGGGDGGGGC